MAQTGCGGTSFSPSPTAGSMPCCSDMDLSQIDNVPLHTWHRAWEAEMNKTLFSSPQTHSPGWGDQPGTHDR